LQSDTPPFNKNASPDQSFVKRWKAIHEALVEIAECEALAAYAPYVSLSTKVYKVFTERAQQEDMVFLEELNRKARLLFSQQAITVAEAYYRLAARFRHYLIDEFQDTSILQWENLQLMVEEALASGGTLFYVGDKKQAIYRFRGGQVDLFDELVDKFEQFGVQRECLIKNWRSGQNIVVFNNKVFSEANLASALDNSGISAQCAGNPKLIEGIIEIYHDAHQQCVRSEDCGRVSVEYIDETNQDERDMLMREKIPALLHQLKERMSLSSVAILTRDNSEVALVTSWLLEEGFSVESEKTLNVLEHASIKAIIAFVQFLHSPIDDLAFASFILSEFFQKACGLSFAEVSEFVFTVHQNRRIRTTGVLYRLFRERFRPVWDEYIGPFFKTAGYLPVYELIVSIYRQFAVFDCFGDAQAFFMKFLELIVSHEDESIGLEQFLSFLKDAPPEELYVTFTHTDSVKVITVHKSKGLQFPVLVIPFLRMDITPEAVNRGSCAYIVQNQSGTMNLLRITESHRSYSDNLLRIWQFAYQKACIDELNNMYVALTRAQDELYVFVPKKNGQQTNLARFFVPTIDTGSSSQGGSRPAQTDKSLITIPWAHFAFWPDVLREEFFVSDTLAHYERRCEGIVLHAILSCIGNCSSQPLKVFFDEASRLVELQFPKESYFEKFRKTIEEIITESLLKPFFFCGDARVYCEKDVVNERGDAKRIDRIIMRDDMIDIIDYKLSSPVCASHKEQVCEYMRIIQKIYPAYTVRGFLLYLDNYLLEEVK